MILIYKQPTLNEVLNYAKKLNKKGSTCYFKAVKGEVHLIQEDNKFLIVGGKDLI